MKRILLALAAVATIGFAANSAQAGYCPYTGRYINPGFTSTRVITTNYGGFNRGFGHPIYTNSFRGFGHPGFGYNNFYRGGFAPYGRGFGYGYGFGPGVSFGGRNFAVRVGF